MQSTPINLKLNTINYRSLRTNRAKNIIAFYRFQHYLQLEHYPIREMSFATLDENLKDLE